LPIATTEEQRALQSSIREWAKRAGTIEAVRGLEPTPSGDLREPDADPAAGERWSGLADIGLFAIAVPSALGGSDGTTADLAAALAQITDSLVPGPVLPTLLASLVLRTAADHAAGHVLPALAAGNVSVATALDSAGVTASARAGGTLQVDGHVGLVLGAGTTTHLLIGATDATAPSVWCILPADQPGVSIRVLAPADFSRSLADIRLDAVIVTPDQVLTGVTTEHVRDLAAALFAVEAAAVASWCCTTAAEYAALRHQFGRPIGSFQAVKHMCATMLCRAEAAAVLAWDAARVIDDAPGELPLISAAAAAYALDAAVGNAKDCIQVLGGIGFTWDHDAHLYLRRALELRQLLGGSAACRKRACRVALDGHRRSLAVALTDDRRLDEIRQATCDFAAAAAALPPDQQRRALADSGYLAPAWPRPHGLAASPAAQLVIDDELAEAGLIRPDLVIGGWAVPAILTHGNADQQERFARPTLRGEITWCQLFSEPEAGSDLASLRTRAERTDGGWLLTGQKVWTSLAREADWGICLARTDPAKPKHKGLGFFLVKMDGHGIDVRPLREMTGREMFNQVFLDQVFVPDECVVGAPGDGWRVARTTLASERVAMGTGSSVGEAVESLLALMKRSGLAADPHAQERAGALVAEGLAVSLLDLQAVLLQLEGSDPGPFAAVRKLVGVGHRQAAAETALELAGPQAAAPDMASTDAASENTGNSDTDTSAVMHNFLLTRCLSIAGGTTQILLSLVAERLLGLPREETR